MNLLLKRILITALVLGGLGTVVRAGTFATFNAQTTNPGNTFATGTLVLGNTPSSGTACLSTAGGNTDTNANPACATLLDLTVQKPGQSGTANLTVANDGSINASSFNLFSTACTDANATGQSYNGTGSPCGTVEMYVQQWTSSTFGTPLACVYGALATSSTTTCDTTFANASSADSLSSFQTAHASSSTGLAIDGNGTTAGLGAGSSAYFTIGVELPSTAGNALQGRQATIDFNWYIAQ